MKKQSSLLGIATAAAAMEAGAKGLQSFGKARDADLFSAGVDLAREGKRINPFVEKNVRNLLGNKQFAPYQAGNAVGKRMSTMDDARANRFLDKSVGMAVARKDRLISEGIPEKNISPVLRAAENYQTGKDRHHPTFNRFLRMNPKTSDPTMLETVLSNATTAPAALIDSRALIRPALRGAENTAPYQKMKNRFIDTDPKRKKVYDLTRSYID